MAEQVNMSSSSSKRRIAAKSGAKSGEKKALELSDGHGIIKNVKDIEIIPQYKQSDTTK